MNQTEWIKAVQEAAGRDDITALRRLQAVMVTEPSPPSPQGEKSLGQLYRRKEQSVEAFQLTPESIADESSWPEWIARLVTDGTYISDWIRLRIWLVRSNGNLIPYEEGTFQKYYEPVASSATADKDAEIERLKNYLHRDQTGLAGGLSDILKYLNGCDWIVQGRGSYEWNDDRYRQESHDAFSAIRGIADKTLKQSGKDAHSICCHSALEDLAALRKESSEKDVLLRELEEEVARLRKDAVCRSGIIEEKNCFIVKQDSKRADLDRLARELVTTAKAASSALKSYQFGNTATDLAEEVSKHIATALQHAKEAGVE